MERLISSSALTALLIACASTPPAAPSEPAASSSAPLPAVSTPAPPPPSGSAPEPAPVRVVCTMEVMRCPDGTEVGRGGPNCEFAACPQAKSCTTSADCDKDQICHGQIGCDTPWVCVKTPPCTKDLVTYCGCDGKTFQGSGTCPAKKYKKKGAC